ncbi:MAG: addiction module protein [Candidatus Binatia bacterium]
MRLSPWGAPAQSRRGASWTAPEARERGRPCRPGFDQLSKTDQIRYLQQLWDRVAARPKEVPVPASHVELAEARLAAHRRAPSGARPANDVIDRLRTRKR